MNEKKKHVDKIQIKKSDRLPIGYCFTIFEDGQKLIGKIISDNGKSYEVKWSDGEITTEIDPFS